jgi:hypothetical protein
MAKASHRMRKRARRWHSSIVRMATEHTFWSSNQSSNRRSLSSLQGVRASSFCSVLAGQFSSTDRSSVCGGEGPRGHPPVSRGLVRVAFAAGSPLTLQRRPHLTVPIGGPNARIAILGCKIVGPGDVERQTVIEYHPVTVSGLQALVGFAVNRP